MYQSYHEFPNAHQVPNAASLSDLLTNALIEPNLSKDQMLTASRLFDKHEAAVAQVESLTPDAAKKLWEKLKTRARLNPGEATFAALSNAPTKEILRASMRAQRQVAKQIVKDIRANEIAPFLMPILRDIYAELEESIGILAEHEAELRAAYPSVGLSEQSAIMLGIQKGLANFSKQIARVQHDMPAGEIRRLFTDLGIEIKPEEPLANGGRDPGIFPE